MQHKHDDRTILVIYNCRLNIKPIAEEFCLKYIPHYEKSNESKHVFSIIGSQKRRKEFIRAIKNKVAPSQ